jgi:prepilin peptidase CpaA
MQHLLTRPVPFAAACLVAFVIAVAVTDMTSRRIPNALTVAAALVGMLSNFLAAGGWALLASVLGLLLGLAMFLPFYLARGFGAGDVKAMAAVGAFLGPKGAFFAAAWILLAGALGGLALLLAHGGREAVKELFQRWSARAWLALYTGMPPQIAPPANDAAGRRFPYGLAIACGTLVSLVRSQ